MLSEEHTAGVQSLAVEQRSCYVPPRIGLHIMTKKAPATEGTFRVPERLKRVLGEPPLLKYEDRRAYQDLVAEVEASIIPTDTIEWLLVIDIVNSTWEAYRYRRHQAALIDSHIKSELDHILSVPVVPETTTYTTNEYGMPMFGIPVTRTITEDELKKLKEQRKALIEERRGNPYLAHEGRDYAAIYADALMNCIEKVDTLGTLLGSAERRRNAALNKLEQYRASRAQRRSPPANIIDADFQDLSAANAAPKMKKSA
jgi:hypothetical protein